MDIVGNGHFPVSADYLIALHEYASERGVPTERILAGSRLSGRVLVRREVRIGHLSMNQVVLNVADALKDPFFPIEYGRRLTLSKHGELGYAAQSASTLWEAALLIEQYFSIRSGGGEVFQFVPHDEHVAFRLWPLDSGIPPVVLRFQIFSALFSIETIGRWLMGISSEQAVPALMRFSFDFPWTVPARLISPGLQLRFNEPVNELRLPAALMHRPLVQSSPTLWAAAREECEVAATELHEMNGVVWQVREVIRKQMGAPLALDRVAGLLGVSARTLKRRLHSAGMTFQEIKDSERFRFAALRLETSRDSLEQIAGELGYSDASNFAKAFRSWSGMNPGEFRKRLNAIDQEGR